MGKPNTVLIVDDDDLVLESIDLLLSAEEGLQAIRALGSTGALSHIQRADIDVVVADVLLAGELNGIDICRDAIAHHPAVAIVVITADSEFHNHDIPERGVFLRKPFGGPALLEAIGLALQRAAAV